MKMNSLVELTPPRVAIFGIALAALVLVGCDRPDDSKTAGQKVDAAAAEVKRDAEQIKESATKAMADATKATTAATQAAVRAVEDTGITAAIKAKLGRRCRPKDPGHQRPDDQRASHLERHGVKRGGAVSRQRTCGVRRRRDGC